MRIPSGEGAGQKVDEGEYERGERYFQKKYILKENIQLLIRYGLLINKKEN
jgi:hypothetical protein